jgi:diguanylate cyclase (GGDEF)-like protein/PAS domain S-box-containing protein
MTRTQASNRQEASGHFARNVLQSAFDFASVGLAVCGRDGRMLFVNPYLCGILGYERAELTAQLWTNYICIAAGDSVSGVIPESRVCAFGPQEARLQGRDGRQTRAHVTMHPVLDAHGTIDHLIVTVLRIDSTDECGEIACRVPRHHDTLTGLPNRFLMEHRLQRILLAAADRAQRVGVLSLGLDRFDNVNDSMGRRVGDSVLRYVAKLLKHTVGGCGSVARTGGDQFVVILPGLDAASVAAQASAIDVCLSRSHEIDGHLVRASARIGVAMFPENGDNAGDLLASAASALHDAKTRNRHACRFFTMHMKQAALRRVTLEAELRRAIEREEFELYYQPKLCIRTGRLSGTEALIRWRSSNRGLICPADFIPIAEDSGLIVSLGEWVLDEALRQVAQWQREQALSIAVAVNVSPAQLGLQRPMEWIMAALRRHDLPPAMLEIEMTESAVMQEVDSVVGGLRELARQGVRIAVDDFGTGHSNLSRLGQFPIASIKIDRSLVTSIATQPKDAAIVRAAIEIAHTLGAQVVAEGVETTQQLAILRMSGCDFLQGYLLCKPLPADSFLTWVKQHSTNDARRIINVNES